MEQKNDFIEREIQNITLFIRSLISKIVKGVDLSTSIQTLDKELKGKLDFGFFGFSSIDMTCPLLSNSTTP